MPMASVNVSVLISNVVLQPGESQQFFSNGRDPNKVRWYSAVPVFPPSTEPRPEFDQQVQITKVFELLFGAQHVQNEVGNLQVNVVITNLNTGPGQVVHAHILEAEAG